MRNEATICRSNRLGSLTVAAVLCGLGFAGIIHGSSTPEPTPARDSKEATRLSFYQSATVEGTLRYEKVPDSKEGSYVLKTKHPCQISYSGAGEDGQAEHKAEQFYIEAHRWKLLLYRNKNVEVTGRLLPWGRFHAPTIVLESIRKVNQPTGAKPRT